MSGRLVVRAPNHLGELILALPALDRAAALAREMDAGRLLVQIVSRLAPLIRMAGLDADVLEMRSRRAVVREASALRAAGGRRGILLTPAISAALVFRLAGLEERRGTEGVGRSWMLTERLDRRRFLREHRVLAYLRMVDAGAGPEAGPTPIPALRNLEGAEREWRAVRHRMGIDGSAARTAALFPGANASSRRWPPDRFAALACRLARSGARVLVFGGPGERDLTDRVADAGRAAGYRLWSLGGETSLEALVGGLAACDVLVTNDTGPMHVAAALGRPVVAIEGAADPVQTGPIARHVRLVGRFDLPCVPCRKNVCPRRGRGFVLERASLECMRLVVVDEVEAAVESLLRKS